MAQVELDTGGVESRPRASMRLSVVMPAPAVGTEMKVYGAGVQPEPYVVVSGRPMRDEGYGASIATTTGATVSATPTPIPTISAAAVTANKRWLGAFANPWYPLQGSGSGASISFPTIAPHGDPVMDYVYTYQTPSGSRQQPALNFNGAGYGVFNPGTVKPPSATLCFVAVMNNDKQLYNGVFEADQTNRAAAGETLQIRYYHGRWDVWQANRKVVSHQSRASVGEPQLFMLAMDATNDSGRLLVIDKTKTSREFSVLGLDFASFVGVFGGVGQNVMVNGLSQVRNRANFDVFEIDYWDRALTAAEMRQQGDLLALTYGIGL